MVFKMRVLGRPTAGAAPASQREVGSGHAIGVVSWRVGRTLVCSRLPLQGSRRSRVARMAAKKELASMLWASFVASARQGASQSEHPEIITGPLGRPLLLVGGRPMTNISFAYSLSDVWAALCLAGWSCGVDVAWPQEFGSGYPFGKVFAESELSKMERMTGDRASAAAVLWSAKEAAVKAWGCGFHCVGWKDVRIETLRWTEEGYDLWVRPEGLRGLRMVPVHVRSIERYWVAVAIDR